MLERYDGSSSGNGPAPAAMPVGPKPIESMRPLRAAIFAALFLTLGGCPSRQEPAPSERLQTVGLKLEAPGVPSALEIAVSMPEASDSKPIVEAMSGALFGAIRGCVGGESPLEFKGDRTLSLRLRGERIETVVTEPGPGTECLVRALETHPLKRPFDAPVDIHVLLRRLAPN